MYNSNGSSQGDSSNKKRREEFIRYEDGVPEEKKLDLSFSKFEFNKKDKYLEIEIDKIKPNPKQVRKKFDKDKLEELATSIKEHGIIQPIVVRLLIDNKYEIIAGERRWKAAQKADLSKVPAIVVKEELSEVDLISQSLIENLQRVDLSAYERAEGIKVLLEKMPAQTTYEDVGKKLGFSKARITYLLNIYKLPIEIQELIKKYRLNEKHTRALNKLRDNVSKMNELIKIIIKENMSGDASLRYAESLKDTINKTPVYKFYNQSHKTMDDLEKKIERGKWKKLKKEIRDESINQLEITKLRLEELLQKLKEDYS